MLVGVGVVVWGLGASLGFPVGMSAGADDPARAAARVSVVSTIGYVAFLAGPPLLGFVADRVGTLDSLLVVAVLVVPTVLLGRSPAARNPVERARPEVWAGRSESWRPRCARGDGPRGPPHPARPPGGPSDPMPTADERMVASLRVAAGVEMLNRGAVLLVLALVLLVVA